jgi:hypothetical protein
MLHHVKKVHVDNVIHDQDPDQTPKDQRNQSLLESLALESHLLFCQCWRWKLTIKCLHPAMTVAQLKSEHGVEEFLLALQTYVRTKLLLHQTVIIPGEHDKFDIYNQVVLA